MSSISKFVPPTPIESRELTARYKDKTLEALEIFLQRVDLSSGFVGGDSRVTWQEWLDTVRRETAEGSISQQQATILANPETYDFVSRTNPFDVNTSMGEGPGGVTFADLLEASLLNRYYEKRQTNPQWRGVVTGRAEQLKEILAHVPELDQIAQDLHSKLNENGLGSFVTLEEIQEAMVKQIESEWPAPESVLKANFELAAVSALANRLYEAVMPHLQGLSNTAFLEGTLRGQEVTAELGIPTSTYPGALHPSLWVKFGQDAQYFDLSSSATFGQILASGPLHQIVDFLEKGQSIRPQTF